MNGPRTGGQIRGITFEVTALFGILGFPVEFWTPSAAPSPYLKLQRQKLLAPFSDFSTRGSRAILWMQHSHVIVVELSASGDPELTLGHGGDVGGRGWRGGNTLLPTTLAVGNRRQRRARATSASE